MKPAGAAPKVHSAGDSRCIILAGLNVSYVLIRSRRRSIGMQVNQRGLVVRAPTRAGMREITLALQSRARWICATLAEWSKPRSRSLPENWRTGEPILVQGRELELALFPARSALIHADLFHLQVRHPSPNDGVQISRAVTTWLRDLATHFFSSRVDYYAARISSPSPQVKLSSASTQWGSCNRAGIIRLHWRLIQVPPQLADYVVAHEVAHLVEMNHSERFWTIVAALCPQYRSLRRELNALTPLLTD